MAFLTFNQIQSSLPAGADQSYVETLLLTAERELLGHNIVFSDPAQKTQKWRGEANLEKTIFHFAPAKNISSVKIKYYGSNSERTLIFDDDYLLSAHEHVSDYYYQLQLLNDCITINEYLEVTGKFGLYINFSDDASIDAKLIKSLLIEWVKKCLGYQEQGFERVKSSSTGPTSVSFDLAKGREYSSSFIGDGEVISKISYLFV